MPVLSAATCAASTRSSGSRSLGAWRATSWKKSPVAHFEKRGAKLYLPRGDHDYAFHVGLRMLALRHLVEESDGLFVAAATDRPLLAYYSNAIAHLR